MGMGANQEIKKSIELLVLFFGEQQSLENWLENNHDPSQGIRLQIAKKIPALFLYPMMRHSKVR
jgi:hypothetical protein